MRKCFCEVVESGTRGLGRGDDVRRGERGLAAVLVDRERYAEAERYYRLALEGARESVGPEHRFVLSLAHNLAGCVRARNELDEAASIYQELVELAAATLPDGDERVFRYQGDYGECLAALGRPDEAEPLLLASYAGYNDGFGAGDRRTRTAAARLIELYEASGRPAEADRYRGPQPGEQGALGTELPSR